MSLRSYSIIFCSLFLWFERLKELLRKILHYISVQVILVLSANFFIKPNVTKYWEENFNPFVNACPQAESTHALPKTFAKLKIDTYLKRGKPFLWIEEFLEDKPHLSQSYMIASFDFLSCQM